MTEVTEVKEVKEVTEATEAPMTGRQVESAAVQAELTAAQAREGGAAASPSAGPPAAAPTTSVDRTRRPFVLMAVMLAIFTAAIEGTIVATSMPSIVASLGGVSLYSWAFSSYLLMQAVTVPIYGRVADIFGRKHVFIFGLVVFMVGSVAAGFAGSMYTLIACRFLQGLGAGAVMPLAMTLLGDMYTLEERGRVQAYTASVWGVSSIVGPMAGALIVQYTDWAWIFWVNLPFGILSIVMVSLFLHEGKGRRRPSVDVTGAVLLLVTLSALMLLLTEATHWSATMLVTLVALAVVGGALFLRHEARVAEPIVSLALWRTPLIALANAATLANGVAMVGLISFLPTYVQGAVGASALVAGFTLSAMSIGWPIAATITGRVLLRMGPRKLAHIGGVAVFVGTFAVALVAPWGPGPLAAASFVLGIGLGTLNTTFLVAVQSTVPWAQRGVATASNMLARLMGNVVGVALFGGVFNALLRRQLENHGLSGQFSIDSVQGLLERSGHALTGLLASPAGDQLRRALAEALEGVFWCAAAAGLITLLATLRIPEVRLADAAAAANPGHGAGGNPSGDQQAAGAPRS